MGDLDCEKSPRGYPASSGGNFACTNVDERFAPEVEEDDDEYWIQIAEEYGACESFAPEAEDEGLQIAEEYGAYGDNIDSVTAGGMVDPFDAEFGKPSVDRKGRAMQNQLANPTLIFHYDFNDMMALASASRLHRGVAHAWADLWEAMDPGTPVDTASNTSS